MLSSMPPELPTLATASPPLDPSAPTFTGYEVQEVVGRGGMGKVYRARHLALARTVAIKVMTHEGDERLLARFRDEARAVARLQHPNIAQLFDTGTADGRPFYSLEFADGGTLAGKWAGRPQDPTSAAAVMETVARAIQYSHEHGILHRDLKPGNVLLTADGTPKVADFGLAKELPVSGSAATVPGRDGLTRTGEIVGTPAYMPPEQASGITTLGPAADVYSLGAMLYEALTGRPPFTAPDALQTLFLVLSTDPVPPKTLQPKLPADLNTICLKCLEKQPRKRYASAGELADDLKRWHDGEPILARPVGKAERLTKWARRHKAAAALVLVAGLLVLAVIGFAGWASFNAAELKAKNDELEKANANADKSFALATSTIDDIVCDTTLKLNGMPNGETLLLDLLARQSELNRQLLELRPTDAGAGNRYRAALMQRSAAETNYGRHEAAARTRAEWRDHLRAELARTPDDPDLRAMELRVTFDTATAANGQGNQDKAAAAARAEYERLADRFTEQFPTHREAGPFRVRAHWFRGFDAAAKQDADGRVKALRDAVATARDLPDPVARFTFLSSSLSQLATVLRILNRQADADDVFAELESLYEIGGPGTDPKGAVCRGGLAEVRMNRAEIAFYAGRRADATKLYAAAEPTLRSLVTDFPLTPLYRQNLAACLFWQGVYSYSVDSVAARKLIEEAIALLDDEIARRPDPGIKGTRDEYVQLRDKLAKPPK